MPKDDPRRRKPDISKAQKHLDGWGPKIPLEEGLKMTIDDFARRAKANPRELKAAHQKEAVKVADADDKKLGA